MHRTFNGQIAAADNQRDLILTLRYGTGAGTQVQQTTLTRDQASANQTLLSTPQTGVIATALRLRPVRCPTLAAIAPWSYTNNTGADREFYLEFTQVGEGTPGVLRQHVHGFSALFYLRFLGLYGTHQRRHGASPAVCMPSCGRSRPVRLMGAFPALSTCIRSFLTPRWLTATM